MGTLVSMDPKAEGKSGSIRASGKGKTSKREEWVFYVLGDSVEDNAHDILNNTPGLPELYKSEYQGMLCKDLDATETDTHTIYGPLWEVTAVFDNEVDEENEEEDDPEKWQPKWRWGYEIKEELLEYDAVEGEDKPIVNAVGEPLFTTRELVIPIYYVTKYVHDFGPKDILDYANHKNQDNFLGFPKGSALMGGIEDNEEIVQTKKQKYRMRRVEYVVKFMVKKDKDGKIKEDGWNARLLNQGTKYAVAENINLPIPIPLPVPVPIPNIPLVGIKHVTFKDDHLNPTTGNLRKDGSKLGEGEKPVFLDFHRNPYALFAPLKLGPFSNKSTL